MSTRKTMTAKLPAGTSGLVVCDNTRWYGVAANWYDTLATIFEWDNGDWVRTPWLVAQFEQSPHRALGYVLSIEMDADDVACLVDDAIEIPDDE